MAIVPRTPEVRLGQTVANGIAPEMMAVPAPDGPHRRAPRPPRAASRRRDAGWIDVLT